MVHVPLGPAGAPQYLFDIGCRRKPARNILASLDLRIPMKSAGDSERKRPPEPIEASRAF